MNDLRYPVGPFAFSGIATSASREAAIQAIAATPAGLAAALSGLGADQLDTPYRDGGWTVRQVVHHVADSHLNAYTRFKLALTEDCPTIKPYVEARWAELVDGKTAPVDLSLRILAPLHERWVMTLCGIRPDEWARTLVHPEYGGTYTLDWLLAMYSWHGVHHTAHVTTLRDRMGWK